MQPSLRGMVWISVSDAVGPGWGWGSCVSNVLASWWHWLCWSLDHTNQAVEKFLCLCFERTNTGAIQSLWGLASLAIKMNIWAGSSLSFLSHSKLVCCISSQARHLLCFSRGWKTTAATQSASTEHVVVWLGKTDSCPPWGRLGQGCSSLCVHRNHTAGLFWMP